MLKDRWRIVAIAFGLVFVPVLVINLLLPPKYSASASVVVDFKPDPVAGAAMSSNPQVLPQYMATQIEIAQSPRVARRVVELMRLEEQPEYQRLWQQAGHGRGDLKEFIAGYLRHRLAVMPPGESNIINITVTWPDPHMAAELANAFAQAYVRTTVDLTVDPANRFAGAFDERARELRSELVGKQKALADFESQNGLVVTDERLDVEQSRLAELSTQLVNVQGQLQDSKSREVQGMASRDTMPEVLASPVMIALKAELARAEAHQEDLETRLGTNHPEYLARAAEVKALRSRMNAERERIIGSLQDSSKVNQSRERQLVAAVDAQKQRIIELKHQHDQAQMLASEVSDTQRALDAVNQRLAQSRLESQTQQANLAMLTSAVEPITPSGPKVVLNCLLASIAGIGIGIAVALLFERYDQRVRVSSELPDIIGVPLLGTLRAAASSSGDLPALPDLRGR